MTTSTTDRLTTRTLGSGDAALTVSALGLGCMGMSEFYGTADETEAVATIHRALDLGVTFLDTADMYGPFTNERLVGRAIAGRRDEVVLATKFGNERREDGSWVRVNGTPGLRPGGLRRQPRAARRRPPRPLLPAPGRPDGADRGHRRRHGRAGPGRARSGSSGLSEAAPDTIRRAHAVHPITALQTEYSLWTRDLEAEILPTLRELGIGLVPYSPLGRGFLTGAITSVDDLPEDDFRRQNPRFAEEALRGQPGHRRHRPVDRRGQGRHAGAGRAGLGAGPGRGRGADPGHQAGPLPGGERRRRRRLAHRGRAGAAERRRCRPRWGPATRT